MYPENFTELCVETWWKIVNVSEKISYKMYLTFFCLTAFIKTQTPHVISAVCVTKLLISTLSNVQNRFIATTKLQY
jgi:hypothetical protein